MQVLSRILPIVWLEEYALRLGQIDFKPKEERNSGVWRITRLLTCFGDTELRGFIKSV